MSQTQSVPDAQAAIVRDLVTRAKTVVVKVGSNVLVGVGDGVIDRRVFCSLVEQIADVVQRGVDVILVTSGAVAVGRRRLRIDPSIRETLARKQALAAVGQPLLMHLYSEEFEFYDRTVSQVLITRDDFADRTRFLNARNTLREIGSLERVIPIVNENDTVANDEIRFGDNDQLAAMTAALVGADLMVVLSDVKGLYTADPVEDPEAELIPLVYADDPQVHALASPPRKTTYGRGGMGSKLRAAQMASASGIPTVIAPGRARGVLRRVLNGDAVGTLLAPNTEKISARKAWLKFGTTPGGVLHVDEGAAEAIIERGTSLLPRGIVRVEGEFAAGGVVDIMDPNDAILARGIANYSSSDLAQIAGLKSAQIEVELGFSNGDVAVHRDDLVLIGE